MLPVRHQGTAAGWALHFTSFKRSLTYYLSKPNIQKLSHQAQVERLKNSLPFVCVCVCVCKCFIENMKSSSTLF